MYLCVLSRNDFHLYSYFSCVDSIVLQTMDTRSQSQMHDLQSHHSLPNSRGEKYKYQICFHFLCVYGKVHQQWIKIGKKAAKFIYWMGTQSTQTRANKGAYARVHIGATHSSSRTCTQTNSQTQRKVKINNAKGAEKEIGKGKNDVELNNQHRINHQISGAIQTVSSAIVMINFLPCGMRYAHSHTWIHLAAEHTHRTHTQSPRTQCLPILRENFNVNAFAYLFVYWLESFCIPNCSLSVYCVW